ncbi:hypothetical protein OH76DRAFT_1198536 [Lentinus brumalis]|uniref:Yip1 domain-containing protein n=1 Tax=Lentinus brumalis TaxID=2498619 RepID=A0A371CTH1_9APHY|nr:hypothetical protein OH76DRAFT_1198536 [Polyporus brumalis]
MRRHKTLQAVLMRVLALAQSSATRPTQYAYPWRSGSSMEATDTSTIHTTRCAQDRLSCGEPPWPSSDPSCSPGTTSEAELPWSSDSTARTMADAAYTASGGAAQCAARRHKATVLLLQVLVTRLSGRAVWRTCPDDPSSQNRVSAPRRSKDMGLMSWVYMLLGTNANPHLRPHPPALSPNPLLATMTAATKPRIPLYYSRATHSYGYGDTSRYPQPWDANQFSHFIEEPITRLVVIIIALLVASFTFFGIGVAILGGKTDENSSQLANALVVGWAIVSGIVVFGAAAVRVFAPSNPLVRSGRKAALGSLVVAVYVGSLVPALGVAVLLSTQRVFLDGFSALRALEAGALGLALLGGPVMLLLGYLYDGTDC